MTSKGRSKKNLAKETAKPEEAEIKKQIETKKGNAKKAASRLNAVAEKVNEAEEEVAPELAVEENGEAHTAEPKQKKRNAGKANAAANGKVETKGKQKKGQIVAIQIAPVNEKEATKDATVEIKTEMNTSSKIVDGNDTKDVSSSKDDNTSQSEEEKNDVNKSADSINSETKFIDNTFNLEIPSNEVGSSESLLH